MREMMIICILYVHALEFRHIGGSLPNHARFLKTHGHFSSQCIRMVDLERLKQL